MNYRIKTYLLAAVMAIALLGASPFAVAATLGGTVTADNAIFVYLSTSTSTLGTLIAQDSSWQTPVSFSNVAIAPGSIYYLNIEAINSGSSAGFLGQFALSGTGYAFSNGSQSLLTDTTDWHGGYNNNYGGTASGSGTSTTYSYVAQSWVTPTGGITSAGSNDSPPWNAYFNGLAPGIAAAADWIWPSDPQSMPSGPTSASSTGPCQFCTVDFSSGPIAASTVTPVPAPAVLGMLLFAVGFLALGRRRVITPT